MTRSTLLGVAVVEVNELTVELGGSTIVDDVSFSVAAGEVVGLLGPNGAGKTTTIETIEGYRRPTKGRVRVASLDPVADRPALADRWGVMPQAGGLPMGLTAGETLELFAALHGSSADQREVLATCGLTDHTKTRWRRLSGGEQQRLSLALALCGGNEVLLLDEPTAALDAEGRARVLDLIRSRAAAGAAVLITTHRFDDVEQTADRVVVLNRGRVAHAGAVDQLTSGHAHIRFQTEPGLDVAALAARLNGPVTETTPGNYQVDLEPTPTAVSQLTGWLAENGLVARSISAGTRPLEEIMLELGQQDGHNTSDAPQHDDGPSA